MSLIDRLACSLGRRDEVPNQELARDLARRRDVDGIAEIAASLGNPDKNIAADCIKVLYEIGYSDPSLIAPHAGDFVRLLTSRHNRMVWGGALALATIGRIAADTIVRHLDTVTRAVEQGSVITQDGGIAALAGAASANGAYRKLIVPFLFTHLRECRAKDVPQHAEKTLVAIDRHVAVAFVAILHARLDEFTPPQRKRVEKVIATAGALRPAGASGS
jgi:hypothetical protein